MLKHISAVTCNTQSNVTLRMCLPIERISIWDVHVSVCTLHVNAVCVRTCEYSVSMCVCMP